MNEHHHCGQESDLAPSVVRRSSDPADGPRQPSSASARNRTTNDGRPSEGGQDRCWRESASVRESRQPDGRGRRPSAAGCFLVSAKLWRRIGRRSASEGRKMPEGDQKANKPCLRTSEPLPSCRRRHRVENPVGEFGKPLQTKGFSRELHLQQQHAVVPDRGRRTLIERFTRVDADTLRRHGRRPGGVDAALGDGS